MDLLANARALAEYAHRNQTDKNGEPHLGHLQRVAAQVAGDAVVVAWLHDTVKDTGVTLEQIRYWFGKRVAAAVDAITHRPHEPRFDYYQRVRDNPLALEVKRADVADNSDPSRLAYLDPATRDRLTHEYSLALEHLAWPKPRS